MSARDEYLAKLPTYTTDTREAFDAAHGQIRDPNIFPTVPDETADAKAKRAAGTVSAMLQQLGQAAKWESDQDGRDGYKAAAALMTNIAAITDMVRWRIQNIIGHGGSNPAISNADLEVIRVLNQTLNGLGAISPAHIFATRSAQT